MGHDKNCNGCDECQDIVEVSISLADSVNWQVVYRPSLGKDKRVVKLCLGANCASAIVDSPEDVDICVRGLFIILMMSETQLH